MKKIFSAIFILSVFLNSVLLEAAEKKLVYHTYDKATGKVVGETEVNIKDLEGGKKQFIRKTQGEEGEIIDEIILDSEYEAITWKRSYPAEDTEYTTGNNGKVFAARGKCKGEYFDINVNVTRRPFYIIPKLSLTKFAMVSGIKKLKFSIPRRDKLTKIMTMKAEKKGIETIEVNGNNVEAIKVYYSATGMRERYYHRDYYFRKSDGIFVKKIEPDGSFEELVNEK